MNTELGKSVVKIMCKSHNMIWTDPWNISEEAGSNIGTGFCVSIDIKSHDHKLKSKKNKHKFILTCSHVVSHPKHIHLIKSDKLHTYKAVVEYRLYELDMCILSLDCDRATVNEFWDDITPIPISYSIKKSSTVYTLGYPQSGRNISVSKGVASRFEIWQYPDSNVNGIALQIDAAVNSGNSGGPAIIDNQVIGIIFSSLVGRGVEGIHYVVPSIMIKFFIDSIKGGSFNADRQFCGLVNTYMSYQSTDDPKIRQYFKIPKNIEGPLVTRTGFARGHIQEFDIITHINDIPIDNSGNVFMKHLHNLQPDNDNDYIPFNFVIGLTIYGQPIKFTLYRYGETLTVMVPTSLRYIPIPMYPNNSSRNYLIVANMAFVPLTNMLINSLYTAGIRTDRLSPINGIQEMVVFVKLLIMDNYTPSYFHIVPSMVRSVNEIIIQSLSHMNKVIKDICKKNNGSTPVIFDFYYEPSVIIVNVSDILINTKLVIAENNIGKRYVGPSAVKI